MGALRNHRRTRGRAARVPLVPVTTSSVHPPAQGAGSLAPKPRRRSGFPPIRPDVCADQARRRNPTAGELYKCSHVPLS